MGTAAGALATAAARVGLSPTEYMDRVNAGLRWCYRDQDWEPCSAFGRDRSRADGLARSCRRSSSAAARSRYQRRPRPQAGRQFVPARDGDQAQARGRVNYLVSAGLLPAPNTLPCTDCGHVHTPGGRRHEYDHHLGYAAEHHEDVQAVCSRCHHIREAARRKAA